MKKIFKNKKIMISIISILIIAIIVGSISLFKKEKEVKQDKTSIINNYIAYIKINPTIKLEYSQTCKGKASNDLYDSCEEPIVTNYELINEDAKNIYKDINLLGSDKDLIKVINLICETARENNIIFDNINIYSDWNRFESYLGEEKKLTETLTFNIEITDKKDIENIIKTDTENNTKYVISFDTNGGNKIDNQEVKKDGKIVKPTTPIKKGYEFIEWQLDGKTFDFSTAITKNITLKAIWKKTTTENNNASNNVNNSNNQNNINNSNNNEEVNEPTTKPSDEDTHKGIINLNDNVTYITGDIVYMCDNCISDSVIQQINSFKGITNRSLNSGYAWIKSINIPEGKYSSYIENNLNTVEDLLIQCGAELDGFSSDWEPKLLTEEVCTLYKLSCDRW